MLVIIRSGSPSPPLRLHMYVYINLYVCVYDYLRYRVKHRCTAFWIRGARWGCRSYRLFPLEQHDNDTTKKPTHKHITNMIHKKVIPTIPAIRYSDFPLRLPRRVSDFHAVFYSDFPLLRLSAKTIPAIRCSDIMLMMIIIMIIIVMKILITIIILVTILLMVILIIILIVIYFLFDRPRPLRLPRGSRTRSGFRPGETEIRGDQNYDRL